MQIRDFYDDSVWLGEVLHYAGLEKTAGLDRSHTAGRASDQFGGIFLDEHGHQHPRFDMGDRTALQLSAAYLLSGRHGMNKVAQAQVARNLLEGFFGFHIQPPDDIVKLAKDAESVSYFIPLQMAVDHTAPAEPIPEAAYAIKIAGAHRFPVQCTQDAQEAVNWFEENWEDIPVEHRRTMATAFEKKAGLFGVEMGPVGQRYLGEEKSWLFKAAMQGRAAVAPEHRKAYLGLIDSNAPLSELAEKLAELDTMAQLHTLWDSALEDPWSTTYNNTAKLASSQYQKTIGGDLLSGEDLIRLAETKPTYVENLLGVHRSKAFLDNPISFFDKADPRLQRIIANVAKEVRIDAR